MERQLLRAGADRASDVMIRFACALAVVLTLASAAPAAADSNYFVWKIAHERMLAKWRHAEPRCGWTVGGYRCARRVAARYWYFQ